ncbi:hypothetical protein Tco_1448301 [Tanacetum coccineum]
MHVLRSTEDAFDERLMVSSSSTSKGSSGPYSAEQPQPSYSPGPYRSAQPQSIYSSGPHRSVQPQPSYSSGPCRSESIECSNCKVKDLTINRLESRNRALKARLRMLEARLEMERNPEDHACQSGAILNELLDDMEDLHMEVLYDARERSEVCMHDLNLSPGNIGTPPLAGSRELHLHLPYGMLHPQQKGQHLKIIVVETLKAL